MSTTLEDVKKKWRKDVLKWYPKLHEHTYFVPPVWFSGFNLRQVTVADRVVGVPEPSLNENTKGNKDQVSKSDELENLTQQRIMHCLKLFAEKNKEVMFVLSQLLFTSYLDEPCFASATKGLPRPVDLKKQNQDRGDFDFLFIHRHFGLLATEVKSVGTMFTGEASQQTQEDAVLAERVKRAIKQLNKSDDVLKHLTSDLPQQPRVTKTLMLPNVTAAQLQRVLTNKPVIRKELCTCLGIVSSEDPSKLCLTSEDVSDRRQFWEVSDDVMEKMTYWWKVLMAKKGKDPNMSKELYEELVARFAGPATTVEVFCPSGLPAASKVVRSEGEGVSETAERFMEFVLYEEQLIILSSDEALVHLSGPPGTGKSVVLLLQAEKWLKAGKHVHIFSMYSESTAASLFLKNSLLAKYPQKAQTDIHYHCCRYWRTENEDIINSLAASAANGELYLICDEAIGRPPNKNGITCITQLPSFESICLNTDVLETAYYQYREEHGVLEATLKEDFREFVELLQKRVTKLHLWVARVYHNFIPLGFLDFNLSIPVRSPGAVTREVQKSRFYGKLGQARLYQEGQHLHTDGPLPRELRHQGLGHDDSVIPLECQKCGENLASELKDLHVGEAAAGTSTTGGPRPLQYRDVFVLALSPLPAPLSNSSGLVTGLRQAGVPVTFLAEYDVATLEQVVTMTGPDTVLATDCRNVNGLEHKIVVWLQSAEKHSLSADAGRFQSYSRTTAQLITITGVKEETPLALVDAFPKPLQVTASTEAEETVDPKDLDRLLEIAKSCITQDIVKQVNMVVDFKVVNSNGEEISTFFGNFKYDGGSVGRGQWYNPEQVHGTVTMQQGIMRRMLMRQIRAEDISQANTNGQLKVDVRDDLSLYRLELVTTTLFYLFHQQSAQNTAGGV